MDLNYTLDHMYLIEKYRTFHPTVAKYTFFSRAHGTFSSLDLMLGQNSLSKFKKMAFKLYKISFLTTMA